MRPSGRAWTLSKNAAAQPAADEDDTDEDGTPFAEDSDGDPEAQRAEGDEATESEDDIRMSAKELQRVVQTALQAQLELN